MDSVICPCCEHDNDMDGFCSEDLSSDGTFDYECDNCGEEFEVEVEWDPRFMSRKIVIATCDECGYESRDFYRKGRIIPWPESLGEKTLCKECFGEGYHKHNEAKAGREK